MKIKNEKEVMRAFCKKDNLHPHLKKPFRNPNDNGRIWATDGGCLLTVDPKLVRCKYPEYTMGIPVLMAENCNTIVKLDDIEAAYNSLGKEPEYRYEEGEIIRCPECDGSGHVDFEYYCEVNGRTYQEEEDCPYCDGSGEAPELKKVPTGRMLVPDHSFLRIDGTLFLPRTIIGALDGLRILGVTQLNHRINNDSGANLFHVSDGIELYIMCCLGNDKPVYKDVKTTELT